MTSPTDAPRRSGGRAVNLVALAIGLVAFPFVVRALGRDGLRRAVVGTGGWFAVIAAIDLVSAGFDAFAMHAFLRASGPPVPFLRVYATQLSGIAINRLTPANSLGEAVKIALFAPRSSTSRAVSTVVMFNLCTIFYGILWVAIGVPATALMLELPHDVAVLMWIGVGILVAFAAVVLALVRRGATGSLVGALGRLRLVGPARAARWREGLGEIDARLRTMPGLRRALIGIVGSRAFNWLGTIAVLVACDLELTAPLVVMSLSVGILVTWMSNVVPLGLGLADGTNYVLYDLLGATAAEGLVFTMVNRLRTVALAAIGLVVMAAVSWRDRRR